MDIEQLGQKKLRDIEAMEKKSQDDVIEFSAKDYVKYVVQNPRPYDVVMMYNVKTNCDHCIVVQKEYKQLVYSFNQERGNIKDSTKEKKIFFGVLYFAEKEEVQHIFRSHSF